jgi:hypothetical protein
VEYFDKNLLCTKYGIEIQKTAIEQRDISIINLGYQTYGGVL